MSSSAVYVRTPSVGVVNETKFHTRVKQHVKPYTQLVFCAFQINDPCQFIPLLNLRSLIFGLTPFAWLRSVTLIFCFGGHTIFVLVGILFLFWWAYSLCFGGHTIFFLFWWAYYFCFGGHTIFVLAGILFLFWRGYYFCFGGRTIFVLVGILFLMYVSFMYAQLFRNAARE